MNFSQIYDSDYAIGVGISHVRRFIEPVAHMPCWRLFLETYADTGHFSPTRYARLSMSLKDPVFLGLLGAYYVTLKANFRVSSK